MKASSLERRNYKWIALFLLPSFLVFLFFYLQPILSIFLTSFTKYDGFNSPRFVGLQNYIQLFGQESFQLSMKNLFLWSLIATILHVGFGTILAFILFQKPRGWKFARAVFMVPNVISAAAWALIYRFIFNDEMGFMNGLIRLFNKDFHHQWFFESPYAFWAVTLTWLFYAVIVTLLVMNDLYSIPEEVFSAAKVDGANTLQILWHIELPMCRISIGTSIIASITARIAMYEQIALTTSGGPGNDTMNLPLILMKNILDLKYGLANASGVMMFLAGILVLLLVHKGFRLYEGIYD